MPRLLGVDIPDNKKSVISLTYLYGVGPQTARDLCHKAGIDPERKARELDGEELYVLDVLTDSIKVKRGQDNTTPTKHVKGEAIKSITNADDLLIQDGDDFGFSVSY